MISLGLVFWLLLVVAGIGLFWKLRRPIEWANHYEGRGGTTVGSTGASAVKSLFNLRPEWVGERDSQSQINHDGVEAIKLQVRFWQRSKPNREQKTAFRRDDNLRRIRPIRKLQVLKADASDGFYQCNWRACLTGIENCAAKLQGWWRVQIGVLVFDPKPFYVQVWLVRQHQRITSSVSGDFSGLRFDDIRRGLSPNGTERLEGYATSPHGRDDNRPVRPGWWPEPFVPILRLAIGVCGLWWGSRRIVRRGGRNDKLGTAILFIGLAALFLGPW